MDYSIQELNSETVNIYELSKFIVVENYSHHDAANEAASMEDEIRELYTEESMYAKYSKYHIAFDTSNEMIGAIRVMKWNRKQVLPMQKIFGINLLNEINVLSYNSSIWHIGRFAISGSKQRLGITLFKQLLVLALVPLYENISDILIAECDCKLVRVLSALGIEVNLLGNPVYYLGSETVPLFLTHKGIVDFFESHKGLVELDKKQLTTNACA